VIDVMTNRPLSATLIGLAVIGCNTDVIALNGADAALMPQLESESRDNAALDAVISGG
jgi:hypothetical protein